METTKTVIEVYKMKEEKSFIYLRTAEIEFKNGIFSHCDYNLDKNSYSYDDWMFLQKVAEKIEEIDEDKDNIRNNPVEDMIFIGGKGWQHKNKVKENERIMEESRLELQAGQEQKEKKMTFDDVVWPQIIKGYSKLNTATDSLTPEGLQKALDELGKDIMDMSLKQIHS